MRNNGIAAKGFTLIELIAVIVILAVLASMGVTFVVKTTESYQSTQARAVLVNTSRQALERMTRQLRIALPYSVRILNSGQCIQFMPIVAGGNYLNPVPDASNGAPGATQIAVAPYTSVATYGAARHVAIGALNRDEIYISPYVSRANYNNASTNTLVQLGAAKIWQRNSFNKRFYLLADPQAFCLVGADLHFYSDIPITSASVSVGTGASIIARNVAVVDSVTAPFSLEMGSENRNTRINIALKFSSGGESINFTQGVLIRNVP
ncbi:PulJ/GspJ family protein [Cellvibrio mixtus]|uniref:PulJ/GspJ family protein n=1 Tax=Cellvibrio mixtus TaxID=39650 RepID=UPI0005868598|nr:type II secretion system protein [Cellvibrio mixtus]